MTFRRIVHSGNPSFLEGPPRPSRQSVHRLFCCSSQLQSTEYSPATSQLLYSATTGELKHFTVAEMQRAISVKLRHIRFALRHTDFSCSLLWLKYEYPKCFFSHWWFICFSLYSCSSHTDLLPSFYLYTEVNLTEQSCNVKHGRGIIYNKKYLLLMSLQHPIGIIPRTTNKINNNK